VAAGARYAAVLILLGFNGCSRSVRPSIQRRGQLPLELRLLRPWFRDRGTLTVRPIAKPRIFTGLDPRRQ
jgi:hypothetical protein